jgi:putative transposase
LRNAKAGDKTFKNHLDGYNFLPFFKGEVAAEVYLNAYDSVSEARASIGRYLDFYNGRRPHSSLDGMTPNRANFTPLPLRLAA